MPKHHLITDEEILEKCRQAVRLEGRFISKNRLAGIIGIPRTTILSRGIDTDLACKDAGFPRDEVNPKDGGSSRLEITAKVKSEYIDFIKSKGKPTSFYEFAAHKMRTSEVSKMSKLYRLGISQKDCHLEAEVTFIENYGLDISTVEATLRGLILSKNRYVTEVELSELCGFSASLLKVNYRDEICVRDINSEYGFKPNLRAFESRIGEMLAEIFPSTPILREKSFKDLNSPTSDKGKLRFDFHMPELNLAVEVDGPSHWDENHLFYNEGVVLRDNAKNDYCKSKGIYLIRVKYSIDFSKQDLMSLLSGIPLKRSVGQPAAKPDNSQEGPETIRKE